MIVHLDFETRSKADLKTVGAHRYAIDPSTSVLMAAVSADDSDEVFLHVGHSFETPDLLSDPEAMELLNRAELVYAHNAPFEQAISWGRGFIVRPNKWRCTAALARKAGLPWSLEKCAEALGLEMRKDPEGAKLIKLFSIPQKDGSFANPKDYPDEWYRFGEYCKQDVRVEKAIHKKLKAFELTGAPLETFLFDLRMNQRGIPVNVPALLNAQKIIKDVDDSVTKEFVELTGYNPTQRGKVFQLVQSLGVPMLDMTADTVQWGIEEAAKGMEKMPPDTYSDPYSKAHRILTLYAKLSFAAAKKVETMLECAWEGTVRGTFTYYGAFTGRWTAQKMQPQNFKKTPKWMRPITDEVYSRIEKGATMTELDVLYGEPLELIAGCIRHFIHAPGRELLDGDYNAIEARTICWLAGQHDILKMWAEGRDLYKFMASQIYGVPESAVDADQREVGKRAELGCGYQMGPEKFQSSCLKQYQLDLPLKLCEKAVALYRTTHSQVVRYWYYLDAQARAAIASPGTTQGPFSVKVLAGIPYLLFKLRSGRSLAYPYPKIEVLAGEDRDQITYWGQLPMSALWGRVKLYGGKLAENETQATAADIMAHGAIEAERLGMAPFALIHDQALAIRENGKTAEEFAAALATVPPWAKGLPLKVEAKIIPYYRK